MTTNEKAFAPPAAEPTGLRGWIARRVSFPRAAERARAQRVVSLLGLQPGEHVLDVGIGTGYSTGLMADQVGRGVVVGVDPSALSISGASRRLRRHLQSRRVTLICADILDLPEFDVSFDKVAAIDPMQLCEEPARAVALLHSRMSEGGLIALTMQPRDGDAKATDAQECVTRIAELLQTSGFRHIEPHFTAFAGPMPRVCVTARA